MMTEKDFHAFAVGLHAAKPVYYTLHYDVWWACTDAVAAVCAASNTRFDRDKFVEACCNGINVKGKR